MHEFKEKYAPKNPYDNIDSRFVTACHYLEYSEYILEEYMNTPFDERRQFENEVESAREFISEWTNYHPEMKKYCKKQEETTIDDLLKRRRRASAGSFAWPFASLTEYSGLNSFHAHNE